VALQADIVRLSAIVFTDIVGYSAAVHRDAGLGKRWLDRSRAVVRKQVGLHGGREIETAGDSFLLLFESTTTALGCLADIQRGIVQANRQSGGDPPVQLRASIHLGDVEMRGTGVYGDGVNIAARILPHSPEGGVAFSDVVARQLRNRISVPTQSIGSPALKNISQLIEIFVLDAAAIAGVSISPAARSAATPAAVHPALYNTRSDKNAGPEKNAPSLIWKFEHAEFDERALELTVGGEPVELEKKPLEVLRHLLWHAGEVVTRDELLDAVWPGRILSESVINKCISRLREVLKDDDQHIIKTAHGYGYRLVAEVKIEHPKSSPLPAPRFDFKPGDSPPLRPQWKLKERLGTGGHGEAWLAEHEKTREKRVYKFAFDDQALVALKREITLYRLLHDTLGERPDFVRIIDWNLSEAPCFTEAEHVEGGNLIGWSERQGGIGHVPFPTRIELAAQIADTLAAAHSVGVLHKDLKPSNVLVEERNGRPAIQLMDFGSGGVINPQKLDELGITRLGFTQVVGEDNTTSGTPLYLPPEVIAGHPTTVQGDIYALGVILYQLVIGDLKKPLAPGWELEVEDEFLREDIAEAAHGNPHRRIPDALILAKRLRSLEQRRTERNQQREQKEKEQQALKAAEQTRHENEKLRARRTGLIAAVVALLFGLAASGKLYYDARIAKLTAQKEAAEAKALSDFLQWDLLKAINSDTSDTRALTASKALLDAGVAQINERLASQPVVAVKVRESFADAYQVLGFPAEGAKLDHESVEQAKRALDIDAPEALEVAAAMTGSSYVSFNEGELRYQTKVYELARKRWAADDVRRLWVENDMANMLVQRGDYPGALALRLETEKSLETADRKADDYRSIKGSSDEWFARYYWGMGELGEAERRYRAGIDEQLRAPSPKIGAIAWLRQQLGEVLMDSGRLAEAESLLTDAVKGNQDMYDSKNFSRREAEIALGELRSLQGRTTEAQALVDPIVSQVIAAATIGAAGDELRITDVAAYLYLPTGEFAKAEGVLRLVIARNEAAVPADSLDLARDRIALAAVLAEQSRTTEAVEQMKRIPAATLAKLEIAAPDRIKLRRTQGLLALAQSRRDEAIAKLAEAAQLAEQVFTEKGFWTIRLREELVTAQARH
jgi:class 3 adenylate cyclase/DNA-binding winged helix-turn-helix (wHTH) protein